MNKRIILIGIIYYLDPIGQWFPGVGPPKQIGTESWLDFLFPCPCSINRYCAWRPKKIFDTVQNNWIKGKTDLMLEKYRSTFKPKKAFISTSDLTGSMQETNIMNDICNFTQPEKISSFYISSTIFDDNESVVGNYNLIPVEKPVTETYIIKFILNVSYCESNLTSAPTWTSESTNNRYQMMLYYHFINISYSEEELLDQKPYGIFRNMRNDQMNYFVNDIFSKRTKDISNSDTNNNWISSEDYMSSQRMASDQYHETNKVIPSQIKLSCDILTEVFNIVSEFLVIILTELLITSLKRILWTKKKTSNPVKYFNFGKFIKTKKLRSDLNIRRKLNHDLPSIISNMEERWEEALEFAIFQCKYRVYIEAETMKPDYRHDFSSKSQDESKSYLKIQDNTDLPVGRIPGSILEIFEHPSKIEMNLKEAVSMPGRISRSILEIFEDINQTGSIIKETVSISRQIPKSHMQMLEDANEAGLILKDEVSLPGKISPSLSQFSENSNKFEPKLKRTISLPEQIQNI